MRRTSIITAFTAAAIAAAAQAQPDLSWTTLDGGGITTSQAGTISLSGTIGQPDAGAMGAGTLVLYGGFWAVELSPIPCPADFNKDGGIDGGDVEAFFAAWEAGDASADVNFDGGIDGADVEFFFQAWEAGGCR